MQGADPKLLDDSLRRLRDVICCLGAPDLDKPTPCAEWSARDLLNHVLATTEKFTSFARGVTDDPRTPMGDLIETSPLASLERCRSDSAAAWTTTDLARRCRLPFGDFSSAQALAINVFDVSVHSWDLAETMGIEFQPPERVVAVVDSVAQRLVTTSAIEQGYYAEPHPHSSIGPDGTRWLRALARTGRKLAFT